eukprot:764299-Pelagomonas_calceolata.AAC.3
MVIKFELSGAVLGSCGGQARNARSTICAQFCCILKTQTASPLQCVSAAAWDLHNRNSKGMPCWRQFNNTMTSAFYLLLHHT